MKKEKIAPWEIEAGNDEDTAYFEDADNPDILVRRRADAAGLEYISKTRPVWAECGAGSSYEREYYLAQGNCCLFDISREEAERRIEAWVREENTVFDEETSGAYLGKDFYTFQDFPLKLHEAIRFAEEKHRGQVRKGTDISYIIHPLEVLQILAGEHCSIELVMAGVLHDVAEDTDGTIEEIREKFGEATAKLVAAHTEKKEENGRERPWKVRKTEALAHLQSADREVKQLVMADSISNLRSMVCDYRQIGDKLWERFNAGKEAIGWFYNEKIKLFEEFWGDENTKDEYWEINSLFKHLFVDFYTAGEEQLSCIYQAFNGEIYALEKDELIWKEVPALPENAKKVSKESAERLEDLWKEDSGKYTAANLSHPGRNN